MLILLFLELYLLTSTVDIQKGIQLSRDGDHEASQIILKQFKSDNPAVVFYRLVNAFRLNKKTEGMKHADDILFRFSNDVPQRYIDLAIIMKAEMTTWKDDEDDLDDITREMTKIADRLKNNKGGKETQELQKKVLARLDKMIKDKENPPKGDGDGEGGGDGSDPKDGKGKKIVKGQKGPNPAEEAIQGQEKGTGQVDTKKLKEVAEVWGKLPEKERAKALIGLTKNLPVKDKAIIERYLKELQKRSGKK